MPTTIDNALTLQFPFAVIDFEASSLSDERSYPIEVGVAIAMAAGKPILLWSSLIQPAAEWISAGHWSVRSEAVHRITPSELADGEPPDAIARSLNRVGSLVPCLWCDGGEYDAHWLSQLFNAARLEPAFELGDIGHLVASDPQLKSRYAGELAKSGVPHRAGADAARLCAAILVANDHWLIDPPSHAVDVAGMIAAVTSR